MILNFPLQDINGADILIGSRVCAYALQYKVTGCDSQGIIEVDGSQPLPLKDVPLFTGAVVWSQNQLAMVVTVEKVMAANGFEGVASVQMSHYQYELMP